MAEATRTFEEEWQRLKLTFERLIVTIIVLGFGIYSSVALAYVPTMLGLE